MVRFAELLIVKQNVTMCLSTYEFWQNIDRAYDLRCLLLHCNRYNKRTVDYHLNIYQATCTLSVYRLHNIYLALARIVECLHTMEYIDYFYNHDFPDCHTPTSLFYTSLNGFYRRVTLRYSTYLRLHWTVSMHVLIFIYNIYILALSVCLVCGFFLNI